MSAVHQQRRGLRVRLARKGRLLGTFVKLAAPDVVELAAAADLDFVVVDLEHSTLTEGEAIGLIRHGSVCDLPVIVRVPAVDPGLICRLLENGAAGIQLSTLRTVEQARALHAACRFAPSGARSVSLANRAAGFGAIGLADFLAGEEADPPFLVGQIETPVVEPLAEVVRGLDVAFVGTTDLAVSLGMPGADELADAVDGVRSAAVSAGVAFGGWSADASTLADLGLGTASYVVVGSDLQLLAQGLRAVVPKE
ncbi:HpcH/HpaI aldolase family protein [Nocardioides sp. Bht2]|uniref:HpcH/HpaI aldolase family protein n=1 Tax=Nocardioides sp. Bht2 TaxID=3392297 RepID=UPI0039B4046B